MKIFLFLLLPLLPVVFFWFHGSGNSLLSGGSSLLIALARLSGLLAAYFALLQLILIGRVKWLETRLGHDRLARWHQTGGKLTFSFILFHVVLVTWVYALIQQVSLFDQLQSFISSSRDLAQAVIAFLLFTVVVIMSLVIVRKRLKYETWYYVHLLTYSAIAFSFGHQTKVGEDFSNQLFVIYWYLLYVFTVLHFVYFRFIRPLYFFVKHRFRVEKVKEETESVNSVYIGGKQIRDFKFEAGQFMRVRFLAPGFWWQSHPFSFSLPPGGGEFKDIC